jgi:rare lipoprotein A
MNTQGKLTGVLAAFWLAVTASLLAGPGVLAESGKATVVSSKFSGKKTASGAKFRQGSMTAASKTLPMGTKVHVKNRRTGKSTTVTINDREGRKGKGVVDLSKSAANKIGVNGTAPVETSVVSKGKGK